MPPSGWLALDSGVSLLGPKGRNPTCLQQVESGPSPFDQNGGRSDWGGVVGGKVARRAISSNAVA